MLSSRETYCLSAPSTGCRRIPNRAIKHRNIRLVARRQAGAVILLQNGRPPEVDPSSVLTYVRGPAPDW